MANIFQPLQQKFNKLVEKYKPQAPTKKQVKQTVKKTAQKVANTKVPVPNLIPMPQASLLAPFIKNKVPNITPKQVAKATATLWQEPAKITTGATLSARNLVSKDKQSFYRPDTRVGKILLGDREIKNFGGQKRDLSKSLQDLGVSKNISDKSSAPLLVGALALSVTGGGKNQAVSKATKIAKEAKTYDEFLERFAKLAPDVKTYIKKNILEDSRNEINNLRQYYDKANGRILDKSGQKFQQGLLASGDQAKLAKQDEANQAWRQSLIDKEIQKSFQTNPHVTPKQRTKLIINDVVAKLQEQGIGIKTAIDESVDEARKNPNKGRIRLDLGLTGGKTEKVVDQGVSSKQIQTQSGNLLEQQGELAQQVAKQQPEVSESLKKSLSLTDDISQTNPYVNTSKLNVSTEARQLIDKTVDEVRPRIEQKIGQTLSNDEAIDLANRSSSILHSAVSRETTLKQEAAVLRLRQELAKAAESGTVDKEFINNLIALKTYGTHIGRQLQSLSIGADPKARTAKEVIMDAVIATDKSADEIIEAAKGVDFDDAKQAAEFYRKFIKPKKSEWLDVLRYNSMLSSPNTHLINASSNYQGTGIIAPIEKTLTGFIDFLGSGVRGKDRSYLMGEGASYGKAYYKNLGNASKKFIDVMRGKQANLNPDVRMIPLATKGAKGALYKTLDFPLRALEAADQFFMTMTEAGEKAALNYKLSKGVKVGDNVDIKALEAAKKRVFRGELGEKDQGYVLNAFDAVGETINSFRKSENPVLSTIAKFTFPFINTPLNVFKQGIEYSPLGLVTLLGNKTKTEQLSKIALGTSAALGSSLLLSSGRTTWKEPRDPKKKDAFRAAGMQPYSVKVGDKWVSYSKLHPSLAFNLALTSALNQAQEEKTLNENDVNVVLDTMASLGNFYVDQSYVKNIGDLVSSAQGDVEGYARLIANYPTQVIPFRALSSWINRMVDPTQRKQDPDASILKKQMQQIMMQFPGLSSKVPARTDPSGNPIKNTNTVLNAFSPSRITTENPENKELYNDMLKVQKINKESSQSTLLTETQIKNRIKEEQLNYTTVDKSIKSMSKTERAKFFDMKLREAKTNEDVQKILTEYSEKGLLTPDVVREILKSKGSGGINSDKTSSTLPMAGKTEEIVKKKDESEYDFVMRKIAQAEKQLKPLYDDVIKDTKKMVSYVNNHQEYKRNPSSLIAFELGNKAQGVAREADMSTYENIIKNATPEQIKQLNSMLGTSTKEKPKRTQLIKLAQILPLTTTYFERDLKKDLIKSFSRG